MVLYTLKVVFQNLCVCSDYRKEYPLVAFNITVLTTEHFRKFQWIIRVSYYNKIKTAKAFRCSVLSQKWFKSKADEGYGCFDVGITKQCMEKYYISDLYYISFIIIFKIIFAINSLINLRISCDLRFFRLTIFYNCLTFKRIRRFLCRQQILLI